MKPPAPITAQALLETIDDTEHAIEVLRNNVLSTDAVLGHGGADLNAAARAALHVERGTLVKAAEVLQGRVHNLRTALARFPVQEAIAAPCEHADCSCVPG